MVLDHIEMTSCGVMTHIQLNIRRLRNLTLELPQWTKISHLSTTQKPQDIYGIKIYTTYRSPLESIR